MSAIRARTATRTAMRSRQPTIPARSRSAGAISAIRTISGCPMTSEAMSPLATSDQIEIELAAVRLLEHPSVQAAIAETGQYLQKQIPHGPRTAARFDRDYRQTVL